MAILFQSSTSNSMLSLKIFLISTSVLSAAIILKLSAPAVTDFAVSEVPSIWNGVVSWLKPPYLYLVINCIIITIVASSKLQNKIEEHSSPAPVSENLSQFHPIKDVRPATEFYAPPVVNDFNGAVLKNQVVEATPLVYEYPAVVGYDVKVEKVPEVNPFVNVDAFTYPEPNEVVVGDEGVISKSERIMPVIRQDSLDYPVPGFSAEKPPASARFGHRKNVKSSPEGGKASLRVSKLKKQDTLESTWKTITEGRAMPLTRHLRKSDTWETRGHASPSPLLTPPQQKMKKSETFTDRSTVDSPLTPSPGSGKLKKEPSLSQDDLNRRVEAFIKKFNEEMRLQRQESLQQYQEMIKRGSH